MKEALTNAYRRDRMPALLVENAGNLALIDTVGRTTEQLTLIFEDISRPAGTSST